MECGVLSADSPGTIMTEKTDNKRPIPPTRPTGQKRSLERGKSTRKKNPGKRAKQGGS
jgi:hypothetical protein